MPLLAKQTLRSFEPSALTFTALDGTDSFTFGGGDEIIIFENTSGTDIPLVLLGDKASTVARTGITDIDVSSGKTVNVPANSLVKVTLRNCAAYLTDANNAPAITGGSADVQAVHLAL